MDYISFIGTQFDKLDFDVYESRNIIELLYYVSTSQIGFINLLYNFILCPNLHNQKQHII